MRKANRASNLKMSNLILTVKYSLFHLVDLYLWGFKRYQVETHLRYIKAQAHFSSLSNSTLLNKSIELTYKSMANSFVSRILLNLQ
jgi:hypothetical protein